MVPISRDECELQAVLNVAAQEAESRPYLSEESVYWATLDGLLKPNNLQTVDVEGAGNCFFICAAISLFGNDDSASFLRALTSLWLFELRHVAQALVTCSPEPIDVGDVDVGAAVRTATESARQRGKVKTSEWVEYCSRFATDNTFAADTMHAGAVAEMFGVAIEMYCLVPENHQAKVGIQRIKHIGGNQTECLQALSVFMEQAGLEYRFGRIHSEPIRMASSPVHYRRVLVNHKLPLHQIDFFCAGDFLPLPNWDIFTKEVTEALIELVRDSQESVEPENVEQGSRGEEKRDSPAGIRQAGVRPAVDGANLRKGEGEAKKVEQGKGEIGGEAEEEEEEEEDEGEEEREKEGEDEEYEEKEEEEENEEENEEKIEEENEEENEE